MNAPKGRGEKRPRLRRVIVAVLVVSITAGAGVMIGDPFEGAGANGGGIETNAAPTSLAEVTRRSLSAHTNVDATLGFAGDYTVVNQATGILTDHPAVGRIVRQGHALYEVGGLPVILLRGSTPAHRSLSTGMEGPDVRQLNTALVALGYATSSEIDPTADLFTRETARALEELQDDLGLAETGTLPLGQAVFLPSAARITGQLGTIGAPVAPGTSILSATSTTPHVTIDLDAAQQSSLEVGDNVEITLPDGRVTPGKVSKVGTVADTGSNEEGASTSPTVTVEVTLSRPKAVGNLDQAPVLVAITTARVKNVLVVPVTALLALAGGGYAVEVVPSGGGAHRLVPVTLGLFDDAEGLVEVSGTGVEVGQDVVVPGS